MLTVLLALIAAGLLIGEWRLQSRAIRCLLGVVCAAGYLFLAPSSDAVARHAFDLPASEREMLGPTGRRLSEYGSGVLTMRREFDAVAQVHLPVRRVFFFTLVWLALSPALRTNTAQSPHQGSRATDSSSSSLA